MNTRAKTAQKQGREPTPTLNTFDPRPLRSTKDDNGTSVDSAAAQDLNGTKAQRIILNGLTRAPLPIQQLTTKESTRSLTSSKAATNPESPSGSLHHKKRKVGQHLITICMGGRRRERARTRKGMGGQLNGYGNEINIQHWENPKPRK